MRTKFKACLFWMKEEEKNIGYVTNMKKISNMFLNTLKKNTVMIESKKQLIVMIRD